MTPPPRDGAHDDELDAVAAAKRRLAAAQQVERELAGWLEPTAANDNGAPQPAEASDPGQARAADGGAATSPATSEEIPDENPNSADNLTADTEVVADQTAEPRPEPAVQPPAASEQQQPLEPPTPAGPAAPKPNGKSPRNGRPGADHQRSARKPVELDAIDRALEPFDALKLNQIHPDEDVRAALRLVASRARELNLSDADRPLLRECLDGRLEEIRGKDWTPERRALEIDRAFADEPGPIPLTPDTRQNIEYVPIDLHLAVKAAAKALARDDTVFQREAELVHVVRVADEQESKHFRAAVGAPLIRTLAAATVHERLCGVAVFEVREGEDEWEQIPPPKSVVSALVKRGEWDAIRPIVGITETPTMRPDGSVLDARGYDQATCYLFAPQRRYPAIPDQPTVDDARAALLALAEPFAEFPFCSRAAQRVPIAAILSLVARPAIEGACPAFVFDASVRGSGKSLIANAISTIAQGREVALTTWPRNDDAEVEKILGSYALQGASIIAWDNVATTFGGAPLDKVLTCGDRVAFRILGLSEEPKLPWRAVMLAGGNNIAIGGDTTRRVLVARIEPMVERPEDRDNYRIRDLPAWSRANHPRLVAAALTLMRAYVIAGRPAQGLAGWGSYEAWRDLVASAIVWAGGDDVMACRPTLAGHDDDELAALRTVIVHLQRLTAAPIGAKSLIDTLWSPDRMRGLAPPDGYDALREALEVLAPPPKPGHAPTSMRLAGAFRRVRRRVVGGRYIDNVAEDRKGLALWKVCDV